MLIKLKNTNRIKRILQKIKYKIPKIQKKNVLIYYNKSQLIDQSKYINHIILFIRVNLTRIISS